MKDDPLNRLSVKRGSDLSHSKLNESLVRKIRKEHQDARDQIEYLKRKYSYKGLAKEYGVTPGTIEKAVTGITWGHVL